MTTLPYITYAGQSKALGEDAKILREEIVDTHSTFIGESILAKNYYDRLLKDQFLELKRKWYQDTFLTSDSNKIVNHPAYLQIIELGADVIPILLEDLEITSSHWFSALRQLAEVNPVPHNHIGNITKMKEDWISWGRNEGLV